MKKIYTLLIVLMAVQLNAQIVYVDPPDMILTPSPMPGTDYDIDIDQNLSADFKINMMGDISNGWGNFTAGSFSSLNGGLKEMPWGDAAHLNFGEVIDAGALTWTDFASDLTLLVYSGGSNFGQEWIDPVTDGYFGFKFDIGGNVHYGWMRIDIPSSTIEMTIKDWAYNATPNQQILAGETLITAVSETKNSAIFNLYHSNSQLSIDRHSSNLSKCHIHTISGQLVKSKSLESGNNIINTSEFSSGIYIISLIGNTKIYHEKIIIQ